MPSVIQFPKRFDDSAARERIRKSLDESLIVEAAAGTGKTSELIRRIVAVLQTGRTTAEHLVAVTFTRKAAGELKLRLRQELDQALQKARDQDKARRERSGKRRWATADSAEITNLENAVAHLEEARIGTIHSFCADILRERPVEANIDPAFQELSEPEAQRLYRQAFRRWSQDKLGALPPGLRRCLSRLAARSSHDDWTPLKQAENAGWSLVERRDFTKAWQRRPFEREAEIDQLVDGVFQLLGLSSRCPWSTDELVQALRPARDLATWIERAEAVSKRDYDTLEGRLLIFLKELKEPKRAKKGRGGFAKGLSREDVLAARERMVQALEDFKRRADADLAALLQDEMRDLVVRYDALKRTGGQLDFVDLLLRVRDLICSNADVRHYLQQRFTHIFVDEFQDTDPLQVEILLLLAADDPAETKWLNVTPVQGKLFLVGDPKQSVYRFRRADLVLYQDLRWALEARGVPVVHLTKSFRALPAIQECINAAFAPEMVENRATGQAGYVPLERYREVVGEQPCVIALPAPKPYGTKGVTKWAIEECLPDAVAAFVSWMVNESGWKVWETPTDQVPVSARHICMLFRRFVSYGNDKTREYLRALEARNIPHLLVGGRSFHSREEVETLRAALTAVEWPDDQLSVFATLKGSLFAIPDSVLLRFRHESGSLHPFRPLPAKLCAELQPVAEALRLLAELHRRRNWRPLVETVNALLEVPRAHAGFALRPAGNQVLANVCRICDLARSFEVSGGISFRGFVEELAEQAEREESPEAPVLEEGTDGVRIMTVHAAKGLEFPVVILADMTAKLAQLDPDMYVDAKSNLCAIRLVGCSPWDLLDHEQEERDRDDAEGVRVAYVAATRARDLLVIPGVGDEPTDGWVSPLNKAIYPSMDRRRHSLVAPGCPAFGIDTVLERPVLCDEPPPFSVKPGLHRPEQGAHSVVWWDPAKLQLEVRANFGIRQKEILGKDASGKVARESARRYEDWKAQRAKVLEAGQHLQFDVFTVTESLEAPADFQANIDVELLEKPDDRPQGARFGTLLHTILRDVDLRPAHAADENQENMTALARLHGRVLGCPPEEIAAAIKAVSQTLKHPLLQRAGAAARCHRELPIMVKTESGRLLEGTIDLAFFEDSTWTIVDFKSDADLPSRRPQYQRQLQWYLFALSKITGAPVRGWLLGV